MEELWENSPKKIEENITEVISDKSSDSDSDSSRMMKCLNLKGLVLIVMQYEDPR